MADEEITQNDPLAGLAAEMPEVVEAFRGLHEAVAGDGALSQREKKLIMVGISVAGRCEPCIRRHVSNAREMGVGREEILEAAAVGMLLGGGPAAAYTNLYVLDELNS